MSSAITSFADHLRQLRTASALSQEELACRAGLSVRGISDLERGVRQVPHLATVSLLADALALNPADRQALLAAARSTPLSPALTRNSASAGCDVLPIPLTSLVGRERELASLVSLLSNAEARLVTLTGAGGTGKTRFALEAGARLREDFGDGIRFVDLAPLTDAALVLPTIAATLGVRERAGQRLMDTLSQVLAPQQLLLIIDNCEQVLGAAQDITILLAGCPGLSVLATSREILRLRGEHVISLPPLPVPTSDDPSSVGGVASVPSVALFMERARANHPDFVLTEDNAAAVVGICRRLEGLPLAIELAAAWINVLPPAVLLDRLGKRLLLLTGGSRDLPPRQRTMRDAIAWSYDLLTEEEQTIFRRLAVFAGGWTLEAAEVVSGGEDFNILAGVETLVRASMVQTTEQPHGERRLGMLETLREFAWEQLVHHGDADETCRRHARYYVALAQAEGANLAAAAPGECLARLEVEQPNLRAALVWLRDRNEHELGLQLAESLASFWHVRSANAEGRWWLETFLTVSSPGQPSPAIRISALRWAGELAGLQGDAATAETHLTESLTLAREVGDKQGVATALRAIGSAAVASGEVSVGIGALTEAGALFKDLGDRRQAAFVLAYLGYVVALMGDPERGEVLVNESEELLRLLGDALSFEANLAALVQGWLAILSGRFEQAQDRLETSVTLGQALSAKGILSPAYAGLAEVALRRGQVSAAIGHYRDGLILGLEGEFPAGLAFNIQGLVRIGTQHRAFGPVARLSGAFDAFGSVVKVLPGAIVAEYESEVARVRAALGQEVFTAAHEAGRSLPLEEAAAEAVALADELMRVQD